MMRKPVWMRLRQVYGSWLKDFSPIGKGFNSAGSVESNAAIFTYYVPHNVKDLIHLIGGNEAFIAKLNQQFELASQDNFMEQTRENTPTTGLIMRISLPFIWHIYSVMPVRLGLRNTG